MGLASVGVTFTVPTIMCSAADDSADAQQYDGVYTDTELDFALVVTYCNSAGPQYEFDLATEQQSVLVAGVAPGDTVQTSLLQSATTTWAESTDLTNGTYEVATSNFNQGDTVVDIGTLNDPTGGFPIPTYTKIKFSNATVNGEYLGLGFSIPTEFETVNAGRVIAKPGALTITAVGSSFAVTFKHAI
jgi:hypothetical protein